MADEPELYVLRFPDDPERRAEQERQQAESRRHHGGRLTLALIELGLPARDAPTWSAALLDRLFGATYLESGEPCSCSCHPQLPHTDLHGYGEECTCRLTAEERRRSWEEWQAKNDAYHRSPAGLAEQARSQAERDEVEAWVAGEADVVITSFGGFAPEQWWGSVAGHRFYFRERHDNWRIELDLRPTGRTIPAWRGGDLDDEDSYVLRDVEEGDVIAEGFADPEVYGATPLERARFIVGTIRDHLRRQVCDVHTAAWGDLERVLGRRPGWCPACGVRME